MESMIIYPLLGILLVVAALGTLILACSLIAPLSRFLLGRTQPPAVPEAETLIPVAPPTPPPAMPDEDDTLAIRAAVIAAAVSAVLAEPHRIISIAPADSDEWDLRRAWSLEGRRTIYQSHTIR